MDMTLTLLDATTVTVDAATKRRANEARTNAIAGAAEASRNQRVIWMQTKGKVFLQNTGLSGHLATLTLSRALDERQLCGIS